jgi:hypothetical protein
MGGAATHEDLLDSLWLTPKIWEELVGAFHLSEVFTLMEPSSTSTSDTLPRTFHFSSEQNFWNPFVKQISIIRLLQDILALRMTQPCYWHFLRRPHVTILLLYPM